MMENRMRRMEVLNEISLEMHRLSEQSQWLIMERQNPAEQRQHHLEESWRRTEEIQQQMDETQQQMREA